MNGKRIMSVEDLKASLREQQGFGGDAHARSILRRMRGDRSFTDQEFHEAQPITLAASASLSRVISFTPSATRCALVTGVAMGVAVLADFDNIRWAVRVNQQAVPGYDNIIGPFGVFVYPKPVLIPVLPGNTVEIVATNLTAVAIPNVTGYLMGLHFPSDVTGG